MLSNACIIFLVLACMGMIAAAPDPKLEARAKMLKYKTECAEELNISDDDRKVMFMELKVGQVSQQMKCFIRCFSEKVGMIKDGKVDLDNWRSVHEKWLAEHPELLEKSQQAIEQCKDIEGEDPCDLAYQVSKCMRDTKLFGEGYVDRKPL